jgi:putative (di)nucleoside polyphosphate hydrolase
VDPHSLPYRPCAGIALFNRDGRVWIGRRIDGPSEAEGVGQWWQMPQGGLDEGEDPAEAARRELLEETNVRSAAFLGTSPDWVFYDLPEELVGRAWEGRFRGQKIRWAAFRFEGDDSEIDVVHPAGGHKPEFSEWRWERLERLPDLVVPFKRPMYQAVVRDFARFAS